MCKGLRHETTQHVCSLEYQQQGARWEQWTQSQGARQGLDLKGPYSISHSESWGLPRNDREPPRYVRQKADKLAFQENNANGGMENDLEGEGARGGETIGEGAKEMMTA